MEWSQAVNNDEVTVGFQIVTEHLKESLYTFHTS